MSQTLARRALRTTTSTSLQRATTSFASRTLLSAVTQQQPPHIRSPPLRTFQTTTLKMAQPGPAHEGIHNVKSNEEWKGVLSSGGTILVDAFATWCGPCKAIAPILSKLSAQYSNIKFYKIDVDELPDVAAELGVRAMPTLFLFKDGKKVESVTGANPHAIEAMVKTGSEQ